MRVWLWSVLLLSSILLSNSNSYAAFDSAQFNSGQQPLSITQITPTGVDVPPSRQIVIQFNRPVVPVGRMERDPSEIPVSIMPKLNCEWRWLNTSSLACQLSEQDGMRISTLYQMTIRPRDCSRGWVDYFRYSFAQLHNRAPESQVYKFCYLERPGHPCCSSLL